jgi:hypothetical protein
MYRSIAMRSITDEPCVERSPIFVKETVKIFKAAFETIPPKTKAITKERMKYVKEHFISSKGPYTKVPDEIVTAMGPVIDKWAKKTSARIDRLDTGLRGLLFKSFDVETMSDARREQIAPAIKLAMERTMTALQADLDGYAPDILG